MIKKKAIWNHDLNTLLAEPTKEIKEYSDYFISSSPTGNFYYVTDKKVKEVY